MTINSQLKILTAQEVSTIYDKSLEILSNKGVKVDHPQGLKILEKAGAQVDFDDQQVRFPKDIIETALRMVPHDLTLAACNERHDVIIPHSSGMFYMEANTGASAYLDPESNTHSDVTLDNVREWAQLVEALDEINICPYNFPADAPVQTADIHAYKATLENTSKHVMVHPYSFESIEYLFQLALARAGSTDAFKKRPIISLTYSSASPLVVKDIDMEIIIQCCHYGAPVRAGCLASAGGTSPITIAGTVLLSSVEMLAATVMAQLIEPRTPVAITSLPFTLDMATGKTLCSSVEAMLVGAASIQVFKDAFHVPTQYYFGSDSFVADGQSMIERSLGLLLAAMVGSDILGGAGQLEALRIISPVQLIIDNMLASILKRVSAGVKVDDDTLAWQEILDTTPGGHFMDREHTLRHCREALQPGLFVRLPMEAWTAEGRKDLHTRAVEKYRELKKGLKPQELPEDVQREMSRIVKHADECLVK